MQAEYALQLAARSGRSNAIPIVVARFAPDALPPHLAKGLTASTLTGPALLLTLCGSWMAQYRRGSTARAGRRGFLPNVSRLGGG
jgi:hypothetical protein